MTRSVLPTQDHPEDEDLVRWLAEDLGCAPGEVGPALLRRGGGSEGGDATSGPLFARPVRVEAELVAKAAGVVCGIEVYARVFTLLDEDAEVHLAVEDGARVAPGVVLARHRGNAAALLAGERTALNVLQRLSGVATLTRAYVDAVERAGGAGRVRVLDTRKTTPGMRRLEKRAVVMGGGENHRFGLFDQAMVKDNHADLSGRSTGELVGELRRVHGPDFFVTAEARNEKEALAAVEADADCVLLDNMTPDELRRVTERLRAAGRGRARRLWIEASGGVTLDTVSEIVAAGVDRISVGALTHSAPALDLSLRVGTRGGDA